MTIKNFFLLTYFFSVILQTTIAGEKEDNKYSVCLDTLKNGGFEEITKNQFYAKVCRLVQAEDVKGCSNIDHVKPGEINKIVLSYVLEQISIEDCRESTTFYNSTAGKIWVRHLIDASIDPSTEFPSRYVMKKVDLFQKSNAHQSWMKASINQDMYKEIGLLLLD